MDNKPWVTVRDFGAVGDGTSKDTVALQTAIDTCAADGGGTVIVQAGNYLTGTLFLKSNVELHLQAGATLRGSPDRGDYNADDVFPENGVFPFERVSGAHLIIAYRAENVSITGRGTIDGNSSSFFEPLPDGKRTGSYRSHSGNFPIRDWRPGQMVFFSLCRNVAVCDVSLVDSPYWTLFLHGCDDVTIRAVTVTNPPQTANGDGIDIDCCANVTISDCIVRSGDDSITLRGNTRVLGIPKPCENVTITNCVLSSPCNAIRVGVGDGVIRNCTISNIVITDSRTGINMVCRYSDRVPVGTCIENIRFSDFIIDAVLPIQVIEGAGAAEPAGIRDVSFSRFRVTGEAGFYIGGNPGLPIRHIQFNDWDVSLRGGAENCQLVEAVPYPYPVHGHPGTNGRPALPCAIYGTHLHDARFSNVRVRWADDLSPVWRDGLVFTDVDELILDRVALRQPRDGAGAAVRCRRVNDLLLNGARAQPGTHVFLQAEETPAGARLRCTGCDLAAAAQAFDTDADLGKAGNLL